MPPSRIVEALDEVEDRDPRLALAAEADAIEQLALERGEEALTHCIVVAVAHRAHAILEAERLGALRPDQRHGALLASPGRGLAPDEAPEVAGVKVVAHDGPSGGAFGWQACPYPVTASIYVDPSMAPLVRCRSHPSLGHHRPGRAVPRILLAQRTEQPVRPGVPDAVGYGHGPIQADPQQTVVLRGFPRMGDGVPPS